MPPFLCVFTASLSSLGLSSWRNTVLLQSTVVQLAFTHRRAVSSQQAQPALATGECGGGERSLCVMQGANESPKGLRSGDHRRACWWAEGHSEGTGHSSSHLTLSLPFPREEETAARDLPWQDAEPLPGPSRSCPQLLNITALNFNSV